MKRFLSSTVLVPLALVLAAVAAFLVWRASSGAPDQRVYRIGWYELPPLEVRGPDDQPTGLAVELVRDAARRRGIRLQWVHATKDPETSLRTGVVDLWPNVTITPERLRHIYITDPLFEADHCLLLREDSRFSGLSDLSEGPATIGTANPHLDEAALRRHFPRARIATGAAVGDLLEEVCRGDADAVYMNEYSALAALLDKRTCDGKALRWISVPQERSAQGIGSTFAARSVADTLRDDLASSAAEHRLHAVAGQWGYLSSNLESIGSMLDSRRRERRLILFGTVFAVLLGVGVYQATRIRSVRTRARQAEKALRYTEQTLRLMADNLHETVVAFDMDRRITYANPAFEKLTGGSVEAMAARVAAGAGLFPYIHPQYRPQIEHRFLAAFQGESVRDEEYLAIAQEGEERWISVSWGPILDEAAIQIGVQCTGRDVTARNQMEERLRHTAMRLGTLVSNSPLAVLEFSPDHRIVNWMRGAERLFGWTADEVKGKTVADFNFVHLDDWPEVLKAVEAMNAGLPALCRNRNYRKDGSIVWCEWYNSVLPADGPNPRAGFSLVLDISDRRQAEEALRVSEAKYRQIVEAAPVGILQSTFDGRFVSANPALAAMFGYDSPEQMMDVVTDIPRDIFVHPERRHEIVRLARENPGYVRQEIEYRHRDGHSFEANLFIRAERDPFGAPRILEGFVEDITERKRAEGELRRAYDELELRVQERTAELSSANQRLQELDRLKSQFLASMSHELRTPLNSIIGFAGLLRQELVGPVNDEQKKQLDIIRTSSRHLLSLINDLLDVSRIEAGRADLRSEAFDFADVVSEVVQSMTPLASSKGLVVSADLPRAGIPLFNDRKRTLQLLLNLVNNAIKFTPGGYVKIAARPVGGILSVTVEDSGIGIKAEHIPMLFEAFRQVDGSARRVYEGTGLGLYLCRKILELMGGRIGVESEFGKGTRFTFTMPLQALEPVAEAVIPGANIQ